MKNKDLKELDMKDLEIVSGGVIGEVVNDSEFLHKYGLMDGDFNSFEATFNWNDCSDKVSKAWETIGIICVTHPVSDNEYFYNGHPITYYEAREIAKQKLIKGPKIAIPLP